MLPSLAPLCAPPCVPLRIVLMSVMEGFTVGKRKLESVANTHLQVWWMRIAGLVDSLIGKVDGSMQKLLGRHKEQW